MKKIILSAALLLSATLAFAARLSQSEALDRACEFFSSGAAQTKSSSDITLVLERPCLFVYNKSGGGFVVISGEDRVGPVLGYSTTGTFRADNLPENILWWIEDTNRQLSELSVIPETKAASPAQVRKAGTPVLEYQTAKWNQTSPYNKFCPNNAVTGCVATAAAIVCRYHEWPAAGIGTAPSYKTSSNNYTIPANKLHSYDYSKMKLTDYKASEDATQVAQLMYDIGTTVEMDYGTSSGAATSDLVNSLKSYFRYDKGALEMNSKNYSDSEWKSVLQKELRENGPILYAGSSDGGHQFVIDGYDDDGFFRFNWGWGGSNDGYYTIACKFGSYDFSHEQSAIIGLKPDKTSSSEYKDCLKFRKHESYNGITLLSDVPVFYPGVSFNVKVGYFANSEMNGFNGVVYMAVCDKNGNKKEVVSSSHSVTLGSGYMTALSSVKCTITGALKGGDKLKAYYEGAYSSGWILTGDDSCVYEILLKEKDSYSADEVAAGTKLSFNRETRVMTYESAYKTTYSLSSGESVVLSGSAGENIPTDLNLSSLSSGEYLFSISAGDEPYEITLKL